MIQSLAYFTTLLRKDFKAFCNEKLLEMGLSQGILFLVLYVGKHDGCSPKKLAEELKMDSGHVARSLVKLEQNGLLIQERNPRDKRSHILKLTDQGKEAFRVSHELFGQWDEIVMADMSQEEREKLLLLLGRLAEERESRF